MADLNSHIAGALGAMESIGPRKLLAYLKQPGPDFDPASEAEVSHMTSLLLSDDPNESSRLRFSQLLRGWDNEKDAGWIGTTARNTAGLPISAGKRLTALRSAYPSTCH